MTALSQAALEIFRSSGPYKNYRLAMLTVYGPERMKADRRDDARS